MYEMSRLGITRCIPRFEVFQETFAIRNVDETSKNDSKDASSSIAQLNIPPKPVSVGPLEPNREDL